MRFSLEDVAAKLEQTLTDLDVMAADIATQANVWNASPFKMMDKNGQPALATLVIARAQALSAYTSIQIELRVSERLRKQQEDETAAMLVRFRGGV